MNNQFEDLLSRYDAGKVTQDEIVKQISADRDRWWVKKIPFQFAQCYLHLCEYIDDKCNRKFVCEDCPWWQQLKKEVSK